MTEYQYYEFVATDSVLTKRRQDELRALLPDAEVSPTGLVSTCQSGDFAADPRMLVEEHFDAFLSFADWGTRRLMFRLPNRLLDLETAQRYCYAASAIAWPSGDHVVLDLVSEDDDNDAAGNSATGNPDDGSTPQGGATGSSTAGATFTGAGTSGNINLGAHDGGAPAARPGPTMASILPVRQELARGDLRMLYLAWLLSVQAMEVDDDQLEPPIPPNLPVLSPALRSLAGFLRIDDALVTVAAQASQETEPGTLSETRLAAWIDQVPAVEKDMWLLRLARDDDPHVRGEILLRYRKESGVITAAMAGRRTAALLIDSAVTLREARARLEAEQQAAERARRERAAAIAREQHLAALATREEHAWQRVSRLIENRRPKEYDEAVLLLSDLKEVNARQGRSPDFQKRLDRVRREHAKKYTLIERFQRAGLVVD